MGSRALDDFAIGVDQGVGLARKRRDLDREFALQPLGAAGADGGKAFGNARQRRQPEADLQRRGQQQRQRQRGESYNDGALEAAGFVVDLRGVAGHRDQITAVGAEIDVALDEAQFLVFGAFRITLPKFGIGGRFLVGQPRQAAVPQRARGMHFGRLGVEPRDLPVPARQRQFEQRLADRLRIFVGAFLGRGDVGDQRAQIDIETAVEGALDGVTIERRERDAGDDEDDHRPAGRPNEQAKRERVSAHRAA